jgi:hypothetical protein
MSHVRAGADVWVWDEARKNWAKARILSLSGKRRLSGREGQGAAHEIVRWAGTAEVLLVATNETVQMASSGKGAVLFLPRSLQPDNLEDVDDYEEVNEAAVLNNLEVRHGQGKVPNERREPRPPGTTNY